MEQLAVRFKTQDLATQFKEVFEDCQEKLKNAPSSTAPASTAPASTAPAATEGSDEKKTEESKPKDVTSGGKQPSLGAMFKPKAGQWECQVNKMDLHVNNL